MERLILYVAGALATWRISAMVTDEEGPFSVFERLRSWAPMGGKWGWVGRGVYCLWCVSFWIGPSLAAAVLYPQGSAWEWAIRSAVVGWSWSAVSILVQLVIGFMGTVQAERHGR